MEKYFSPDDVGQASMPAPCTVKNVLRNSGSCDCFVVLNCDKFLPEKYAGKKSGQTNNWQKTSDKNGQTALGKHLGNLF